MVGQRLPAEKGWRAGSVASWVPLGLFYCAGRLLLQGLSEVRQDGCVHREGLHGGLLLDPESQDR